MVLRGKGKGKGNLQDELDELSRKDARRHVGGGGGHVDMTQDTRGLRGVIVA